MSEAEGGLVNKSIFTVQQHYHKQETTILNDMDSEGGRAQKKKRLDEASSV